jgi:hypothetical protein
MDYPVIITDHRIKKLQSLIKFDLISGPFITGSYLTWLFEKELSQNPTWLPGDLDICCTSEGQFQQVKQILEPLATDIKETNWLGRSTYWTIDDFKYQAFVHPVTVEERLNIVDYTITAIACDGKNFIAGKTTLHDIKHKLLKYNIGMYRWPRPIQGMEDRYYKYLDRGYVDNNNESLAKLKHLHELWGGIK